MTLNNSNKRIKGTREENEKKRQTVYENFPQILFQNFISTLIYSI